MDFLERNETIYINEKKRVRRHRTVLGLWDFGTILGMKRHGKITMQ